METEKIITTKYGYSSEVLGCCNAPLLNVNNGIGICPVCGEWCCEEDTSEGEVEHIESATDDRIGGLIDDLAEEQYKVFGLQQEVKDLRFGLYITIGVLVVTIGALASYILGNIIYGILR